jgi:fibronectin-binding autotransporter adhesin
MFMLGTALGCTLGISGEASAQNVTYNGPGPYALTQTTPVNGGPRAIDVTVTSDNATIDTSATTVTSTNNGTAAGVGIGVSNTGPGNVLVHSGDVTANGTGPNTGIDARATSGTITITNSGTINASGNNGDRAIVARSGGGDVVINSNIANGQQYGIIVTGNGGTFGDNGTTTITSTNATANGTGLINAIVGQGYRVVINSGTASNTNAAGVQGTAIFANASAGGVLINAATTSALGQNQSAIQVFSEGAVDVTSGAIRTTQNSDGLSIQSGTDVVARSTSIVTEGSGGARGIVLGGNAGGGGFNGGPNGFAYNSAVVTSGSITTAGNGAYGIYATPNGTGSLTINSGAITTTGPNANGIYLTQIGTGVIAGPVTINSTGLLQTSGAGGAGIRYNGGTGTLAINNSGTISTTGTNAIGVLVFNANGAAVNSNAIATTGGGVSTGIQIGSGASATNPIAITSGTINLSNAASSGSGILVTASNSGATTITSGTINVAGTGSGIALSNPAGASGDVSITSGDITLSAPPSSTFRQAIGTFATAGTTTITSTGTIQSGGNGILVQARSGQAAGAVNITSNVINSANTAISVAAGSSVAVKAATTATSGDGQAAIVVTPTAGGAVTIQAGSVTTTGANALGISVGGNVAGTTSIGVTTANTTASAVDARTVGNLSLTAGNTSVTGANATGLTAISTGGTATVNSTSLTSANRGIYAQGLDNVAVTSGTLISSNADYGLIARTSAAPNNDPVVGTAEGVVNVTSGTLTATNIGINAYGPRATVNVNSGTVTTGNGTGIQAFGIDVNVTSGTVNSGSFGIEAGMATGASRRGATIVNSDTINLAGTVAGSTSGGISANGASVLVNSGTITSTGLGNRFGISAQVPTSTVAGTTLPGTVTINSGSITTIGDGAYGIQGITDSGALNIVSTGTITTGGTTRIAGSQPRYSAGIVAFSPSGSITVASNNISTAGAQADGIRVEAGSGGQGTFTAGPNNAAAPISVTTSGATRTAGANASGIDIFGGGGAVTVANTGTIATGGANAYGISVAPQSGATTITSNAVTTSGDGSTGIRVAGGSGAVAITAATTTTSGTAANAIDARSSGDVSINGGTARAARGNAIFANAGGAASVQALNAGGGGDGGAGVTVTGGTGVTLNVAAASSNGATLTDAGTGTVTRADAIFAQATNGAIKATIGSATAQGAGADGIRLIANGTGGAVTLSVTGTVSSASGNGIFIDPPGAVSVNVASGASVTGATAGLNTTGATNSIVNAGSITSSGGPAILASGTTSLDNSGTLVGAKGIAVQLGASDDSVILRTGSNVTGAIAGGGGTDTATLIGTGTAASASQTVATLDGFSRLNVSGGYWTASSAPSSFGSVAIDKGAALELRPVAGGSGLSILAPTIADAGTLVVRTASGTTSSFGSTQLTGAGVFNVTGAGTLTVATDNSGFTGNTLVDGGTLQLTGTLGKVETAAGGTFVLGNGGTSGNVTGDVIDNGTFVANRSDNYALSGGLSGNGTFVKQGAGSFTFGGAYTFTGAVNVVAGSIRFGKGLAANSEIDLSGGGKLDLSGQSNSIAELAGSSATASIDITGGTLTDNQSTNTIFAGSLTGAGGTFNKTGAGTLNLTGASTYTGPTNVTGGTLAVNGSIASIVSVTNGGKLGGNGTVAGVNAGTGGIVGPGNSIGTLNVAGNVAFGPGSTYQVEANAAGQADKIVATGTATLTGGTVAVLAQPGTYARVTGYTILTANGGVSGTFSNVTSNLAFLSPLLSYSSNSVQLTLARNDIAFSAFAGNANQVRTANAVQALGLGNGLYNLVLGQTDAGTGTALASLATEIHAGVGTAILEQERDVREAMLDRARAGTEGTGLWLRGVYDWAHSRGGSSLRLGVDRKGVLGGIDGGMGGLRVGAIGGYVEGDVNVRSQAASAKDRTKLVGVYAGWGAGGLSVRGGANWSWHDIDTSRAIAFPGLAGTATASYQAQSGQIFGEIAYNLLTGPIRFEPFADFAHLRNRTDGFAETGSTGALNVGRDRRDADFATLGLRLGGTVPMGPGATLRPRLSAAWQRGWGDLRGTTVASFGPGTGTFLLTGAGVGRDTLVLDGGFDADLGGGLTIGASANAGVSNRWSSSGLRATLGLRF